MKKPFLRIVTIFIILVIVGFACTVLPSAKSTSFDVEAQCQLTVTGLVVHPSNLSWAELVAFPRSTVNAALICVDAPSEILMQGNWTGIKLRTLLEEAKPLQSVIKVAFFAADGYSTDLPLETAMRDDVILAYENGNTSLNDLRLVVPGKWGYKWISQLTRIELVDYNFLGRWESAGYSDEADISSGGGSSLKDLGTSFPFSPAPSPTKTSPSPVPTQPPNASPVPFDKSMPTPEPAGSMSIPTEAIYIIVGSAFVIALVAVLTFVRRKP